MTGGDLRFFPSGYGLLLDILGGGVAAGRMLTAFGLALVMCILARAALRNTRYVLPISAWTITALIATPSVFSNTLSPSVDMLYSALGLSLLAACFIIADDEANRRKRFILQFLLIVFLSQWLMVLRYHSPVLLVAATLALIPSWNKRVAVYASILLVILAVLILNFHRPTSYSSAAKEQVWCGLEFRYHRLAERGVLDGQPRAGDVNGYVWDQYATLNEVATSSSYLDYYSPAELLKHGAANYYHYLRRPLVLLGIGAALASLMLGIRRKQAACALIFLLLYPLPLSAAYYTLRASLLTELAGLAVAAFLICELSGKLEGKRRIAFGMVTIAALILAIGLSLPRLQYDVNDWRSQLVEAKAVEDAIRATNALPTGIWTEDTGITIRFRGEVITDTSHAYNSWLTFADTAVPPKNLIAGKGGSYRMLLIRTPELARQMQLAGDWKTEEVNSYTKTLYVLTRK